ncbi:MAG: hypothetical protein ACRDIB_12765, partial [Ardenticatenaceae bacterium]
SVLIVAEVERSGTPGGYVTPGPCRGFRRVTTSIGFRKWGHVGQAGSLPPPASPTLTTIAAL